MDGTDLQDDIDKLSKILAQPIQEDPDNEQDVTLCISQRNIDMGFSGEYQKSPSKHVNPPLRIHQATGSCDTDGQLTDGHPKSVRAPDANEIDVHLHLQCHSDEPHGKSVPPVLYENGSVTQETPLDTCPDQKCTEVRENNNNPSDVPWSQPPDTTQSCGNLEPSALGINPVPKQSICFSKSSCSAVSGSGQIEERVYGVVESSVNGKKLSEQQDKNAQPRYLLATGDTVSYGVLSKVSDASLEEDWDKAESSSLGQCNGTAPPPPRLHCNPPFDLGSHVMNMDQDLSGGGATSCAKFAGGNWLGTRQPVDIDENGKQCEGMNSEKFRDVASGKDSFLMEWTEGVVPMVETGDSSGLQGDISKLSRALAAAPVAPPLELGPPSLPVATPSSTHHQSLEGSSFLPSVASDPGGVEVLSQDDFLDDTFADQDIPVNLENCLALNAAYQEVVDENLADLERLLRQNRARQAELVSQLEAESCGQTMRADRHCTTRRWSWAVFVFNHFSDADGFGPPPNADTKAKAALGEYVIMRQVRPWVQSERECLFKAVLTDARRRNERSLRLGMAAARATLNRCRKDDEESVEARRACLADMERKLAGAGAASVIDIVANLDDDYDWQHIAATDLNNQRTANECRLQWCNFVKPSISHAEWTSAEDERVRTAAGDNASDNPWQSAADELGRSTFQVFQRYATVLSVPTGRQFWTKEETGELMSAVRDMRIGNFIKWTVVASRMEGRTGAQCRQRYLRVTSHRRRYERFSEEEDLRIIAAFEVAGITDWWVIAKHLPGRIPEQLRTRYLQWLKPGLSFRDWSREEDEKLVRFVRDNGPMWSHAARELGGDRCALHCRLRFRRIEFAFQSRGGVPVSGSLAGRWRGKSSYYDGLREKLNHRLACLMPSDMNDANEARKKAAVKFVLSEMPRVRAKTTRTARQCQAQRKRRQLLRRRPLRWSELGEILNSEGRQLRLRNKNANPVAAAAAAAATARIWCLLRPTAAHLDACAVAGPPITPCDALTLAGWRDALTPASGSPAKTAVSAVGAKEYNWRRMPLLPPSHATCSAFRSLMLQQPRLEDKVVEYGGPASTRHKKLQQFKETISLWAACAMSGRSSGVEGSTPWLMPTDNTRHVDRMVRVRVVEKEPNKPARQFALTMASCEADDPEDLARRLRRQIPHLTRMDISRAPTLRAESSPSASLPGPPPPASASGSWHLLLARFVSMFFWPALLSVQPPPSSDDGKPANADVDIVDNISGSPLVLSPDKEEAGAPPAPKRAAINGTGQRKRSKK